MRLQLYSLQSLQWNHRPTTLGTDVSEIASALKVAKTAFDSRRRHQKLNCSSKRLRQRRNSRLSSDLKRIVSLAALTKVSKNMPFKFAAHTFWVSGVEHKTRCRLTGISGFARFKGGLMMIVEVETQHIFSWLNFRKFSHRFLLFCSALCWLYLLFIVWRGSVLEHIFSWYFLAALIPNVNSMQLPHGVFGKRYLVFHRWLVSMSNSFFKVLDCCYFLFGCAFVWWFYLFFIVWRGSVLGTVSSRCYRCREISRLWAQTRTHDHRFLLHVGCLNCLESQLSSCHRWTVMWNSMRRMQVLRCQTMICWSDW